MFLSRAMPSTIRISSGFITFSSLAIHLSSVGCASAHHPVWCAEAHPTKSKNKNRLDISRRSTVPKNLGKTPKPSSDLLFQADGGGGVFCCLEVVPVLMHSYATAWAGSFARLRFIPVAPGS